MRVLVRTRDAESFLRALSITVPRARGIEEMPEMNQFAVEGLPADVAARLQGLGARLHLVRPAEPGPAANQTVAGFTARGRAVAAAEGR